MGRTTVMLQEISGEAFQFTQAVENVSLELQEIRYENRTHADAQYEEKLKLPSVKPKRAMLFRGGTFVQVDR